MEVTAATTIMGVIKSKKDAIEAFARHGLSGCAICHASRVENLAEGAAAHGIDLEALLKDLNELEDLGDDAR